MKLHPKYERYIDRGLTSEKIQNFKDALAVNLDPRPLETTLDDAVDSALFYVNMYVNSFKLEQFFPSPSQAIEVLKVNVKHLRQAAQIVAA